jgi:hypothetical protein
MAETRVQKIMRQKNKRDKKFLAKKDDSLFIKNIASTLEKKNTKKDKENGLELRADGSPKFTSPNVQIMMDKAAPGGKQPNLSSKEAQSMMIELGIGIVGGGALKIGGVLYKGIGAAAKALANMPMRKAKKLLTTASKTVKSTPRVGKPQGRLDPPKPIKPPVLSKVGKAREARRNAVNKREDLASVRKTPNPNKDTVQVDRRVATRKTTAPTTATKTKKETNVPAVRRTTAPTTTKKTNIPAVKPTPAPKRGFTLGRTKSDVNPLLPLSIAGATGAATIAALNTDKPPKPPKPSKKPKFDNTVEDEGTGALFKPEYDNTVDDEGTGAKLKPKKSKKKKDPHYKLYDNVLGKKLGMAGMTDAGYEAEEDKISEYKSGGKIKKLKYGGKVMKKAKSGFMGKGAGCARTGY